MVHTLLNLFVRPLKCGRLTKHVDQLPDNDGGCTTFGQFKLKHLFVFMSIIGVACGALVFAREHPIVANGIGAATVMLTCAIAGFGISWWRASACLRCKANVTLGHAVANGATGWFIGNIAFFGILAGYVWLEQLIWPDALRDELGGPLTLLLIGGLCYGVPSLFPGACVGAFVWLTHGASVTGSNRSGRLK